MIQKITTRKSITNFFKKIKVRKERKCHFSDVYLMEKKSFPVSGKGPWECYIMNNLT